MRLRVYNIEGKIFLKLSRHVVKQSAPSRRKNTHPRKQNKQFTCFLAYKTDKTRKVDYYIRVIVRKSTSLIHEQTNNN